MTKKELRAELDRHVLYKLNTLIDTIRDEYYTIAKQEVDAILGIIDFAEGIKILDYEDWEIIMTTFMNLRYKMEYRFKDYDGKYTWLNV